MQYVATCLFGLEGLLGEEIDKLGYKRLETIDGRILFEGDATAAARCNIQLRFAERVLWCAGSFIAASFDQLFEGTKSLPWEEMIGRDDQFPVKGHSIRSALFSIPDCQKIVKKAIATRLGAKYGLSVLPETAVKYQVEFFILKDKATLMIDLSGVPLHKRGYRPETVTAPLRETLAAAIAAYSRPRENVLLWDPFCGSGTIACEAALMMHNMAPGVRRRFAAQDFPAFPAPVWRAAREEAMDGVIRKTEFRAWASDIDPSCVAVAEAAMARAGVSDTVKCFQMDALTIDNKEGVRGTIVTNPPYGERLLTVPEAEELYGKMGTAFRRLERWQMYVLTPNEKFQTFFGRRADKIRKLYNGMIPCLFYQFFKNEQKK